MNIVWAAFQLLTLTLFSVHSWVPVFSVHTHTNARIHSSHFTFIRSDRVLIINLKINGHALDSLYGRSLYRSDRQWNVEHGGRAGGKSRKLFNSSSFRISPHIALFTYASSSCDARMWFIDSKLNLPFVMKTFPETYRFPINWPNRQLSLNKSSWVEMGIYSMIKFQKKKNPLQSGRSYKSTDSIVRFHDIEFIF